MAAPLERIDVACREVGRERATLGITALIGLWFPDLQPAKPSFFDQPLTGTPQEIATAMGGYAELGVEHVMFQCEPYVDEFRFAAERGTAPVPRCGGGRPIGPSRVTDKLARSRRKLMPTY